MCWKGVELVDVQEERARPGEETDADVKEVSNGRRLLPPEQVKKMFKADLNHGYVLDLSP